MNFLMYMDLYHKGRPYKRVKAANSEDVTEVFESCCARDPVFEDRFHMDNSVFVYVANGDYWDEVIFL